ncbi:metallophosphoesterase [Agrobacterium tumefaciens]|uniref:metallophosphoesterase n=1 Tax=Agrobacterium tumefaciens TaxID=358 RepID=UPI0011F3CB01|nr:metallophosphoesterase [Agrobacterium tumefaciens]KAA1233653.1 metallophosphoesterase [Agrobacterium tumefaciens]
MLLLHVSDIHFRSPDCTDPETDPTRPNRSVLVRSLKDQVRTYGNVDALLIGGDIAFRGHPDEYVTARDWIDELVQASGCPPEKIFVVPGNHDVDQRVITGKDPSARNVQQAIVRAEQWHREKELRSQLYFDDTARALLAPIAAYNDFAKKYQCQVLPKKLFWKQDVGSINGVTFRLFGLNSTILSGAGMPTGRKDALSSLYLSNLQTGFEPVDNVVNMAMCHHPFTWFMDAENVRNAFENRTTIQFFGHNHVNRAAKDDGWVRFEAGAVNPDPYETGWEPGYNLIKLDVTGAGQERKLIVRAHVFVWQSNPDSYQPKQFPGGRDYYGHIIDLPEPVGAPLTSARDNPAVVPQVPTTITLSEAEPTMGDTHTRRLIYRFWDLTMSQRRDIVFRLKLLDENEMMLPDAERYGLALLRASERQQLMQLEEEISREEGNWGGDDPNE